MVASPSCLKIYDINLRQNFYDEQTIVDSLGICDVVNREELDIVSEMLGIEGDEQRKLTLLVERYGLSLAAVTRGKDGSILVSPDEVSDYPGEQGGNGQDTIVDTIGAGDAFTAVIAMGLLHGWPLDEINNHANLVAVHVCGATGAMVPLSDEMKIGE
jgi:fructokinase